MDVHYEQDKMTRRAKRLNLGAETFEEQRILMLLMSGILNGAVFTVELPDKENGPQRFTFLTHARQ